MKIYVKDTSGSHYECEVSPSTTAGQIAADFLEAMEWPHQSTDGMKQRAVVEFLEPKSKQYIRLRPDQALNESNITDGDVLMIFPERSAGCFTGGMHVSMLGGKSKKIAEITVGDTVLVKSFESGLENSLPYYSKVKEVTIKKEKKIYCINNEIFTTGEQKIWTKDGLKKASQITQGDILFDAELNEVFVEDMSYEIHEEGQQVYNLTFEETSALFFVHGICVGDMLMKVSSNVLWSDKKNNVRTAKDITVKVISLFGNTPDNTFTISVNGASAVGEIVLMIQAKVDKANTELGLVICKETGDILRLKSKLWEQNVLENYTLICGYTNDILDLFSNSKLLSKIPNEVIQQGAIYVVKYLDDIKDEETGKPHKLLECKMAFLGKGFVGKTSLISMLRTGAYDLNSLKTDGIEISTWAIRRDNETVKINIWDFGGQEITKLIHKIFLTERTIYVLVTTLRITDYLGQPDIDRWIKLVHQYAPGSPIIIVVNKTDEESRDILERKVLLNQYPQIVGFVETSCTQKKGIADLKKIILSAIRRLNHIDDLLPASFFKVKNGLQKEIKNYLNYGEYKDICKKINNKLNDEDLRSLTGLLNDLGLLLNVSKGRLKDTNILQPEWIVKGIFQILGDDLLKIKKGEIRENELLNILDDENYPTSDDGRIVLNFMVHFNFCYRKIDGEIDSGLNEFLYFFPSFFQPDIPDEIDLLPGDSLTFIYKYAYFNDELFLMFVIGNYYRLTKYWLTGCLYDRSGDGEETRALILANKKDSRLVIKISGHGNKRLLLDILRDEIKKIHARLNIPQGEISEFILDYIDNSVPIDYNDLIILEREGHESYYIPKLRKSLSVKMLLYGSLEILVSKFESVISLIKSSKIMDAINYFDNEIENYPLSKSEQTEWILLQSRFNNIQKEKSITSKEEKTHQIMNWTKDFLDFLNTLS